MIPSLFLLLARSALIYLALAVLGGWLLLLLRRLFPRTIRPPAVLLGLVFAEAVGWYWSSANLGLNRLWPPLLTLTISAGVVLLWQDHRALIASARSDRGWLADLSAGGLALALQVWLSRPLVGRGILSVASVNSDVAYYALEAAHLGNSGFRSPGSISGYDLAWAAMNQWYGMFNATSLSQWINDRNAFQVAQPLILVGCVVLAQTVSKLLRRTTPLPNYLIPFIAALTVATYLFNYLVTGYFVAQVFAMAFTPIIVAVLAKKENFEAWPERIGSTVVLTLCFVGMLLFYPHMLFLFLPLAGLVALIGCWRDGAAARRLVAVTALAFALMAAVLPERTLLSIQQTLLIGSGTFGWPEPGVTPWELVVNQSSFNRPFSGFKIIASLVLLCLAVTAAFYVRRRSNDWAFPKVSMIILVLVSYAAIYYGRGGATYVQWKWISFFQPLFAAALLAALCGWFTLRRTRALGIWAPVALCLVLLVTNTHGAMVRSNEVYSGTQWVSLELGFLGSHPALRGVKALNVDLSPYWETMWAAVALSPRTLYLQSVSYYSVSEPRAEWTLVNRGASDEDLTGRDVRILSNNYALVRASTDAVDADLDGIP